MTTLRRPRRTPKRSTADAAPLVASVTDRPLYFVGGPWHGELCHDDAPKIAVGSPAALYYKCGVNERFNGLVVRGCVFRWTGLEDDATFRRMVVSMLIAGAMR